MLKIRALNRESSSDEDVPVIRREAQEEIVLELYNKALRLQAEQQYVESKLVLEQLLNENIPGLENNGGLPKSMQTLKYSCHVNIGNIHLKLNEINQALETFLLAAELDSTDVTLWYKIGKLSLKENKFRQSAYAFSKGLECSESHWPCLDQLISILFAIKDTVTCLMYIGKALMLDSEYMKGHALRKQIYLDNPATREYYQLYNPDHIWEPEEIDVDEEEAKEYLEEAQLLCDRVTGVEKSFGPKPLPTIPLPKPLEDYSWISVAKTIIYLHQYITDQGMSHFTFIDMANCMSVTSETSSSEHSDAKCVEEVETKVENRNGEEKMQVDSTPERRQSVNSEANNDRDVTPIQTDNDEEQNMDPDTEEQEDQSESKTERGRPKGSKRKRDLLSDLQIWGWHSKRKQSKKAKEKDFTVEDALNRIIPNALLPNKIEPTEKVAPAEESMNTMDIYNMYMEENQMNYLSPVHSPASVNFEPYFGTGREENETLEFWSKKRDRIDAVVLIKDLVFSLSKLWYYKWPKELVALYVQAYGMFREHYDPPQLFCGDETFEQIRNDALATILYSELFTFSTETKENLNPTILGYLQIVSSWQDQWQDEFGSFFIRVCWLRSHLFRKENSNDLAIRALQVIQDTIDEEEVKSKEKFLLSLPNCLKHGLITRQITEKILKHLDLIDALGTVESLYNSEKYVEVAEIIKSTFKLSRVHPQVGRLGRPAQIGLLLHSLWYTDLIDCFVWSEECIFEALDNFLKPGKESYKWEKIVEKCLAIFHEIIKKETVNVIDYLSEERKIRLVETLSKIICRQVNTDSLMPIPLGCITPWILLHYILVRDEQRKYANKRISKGKKDKTETNDAQESSDDELPASISILFSAHEFLGPKGWCLTGEGEMLHFILDTLLDRLDTPVFERLREKIDIHIEQALFCLYQHPSKKNKISRHLADHNVDPLPLTWERSFQLFEFYGPTSLPEFNSYKNASISADLEQLFKRIIALVPQVSSPQQHLTKIMDYIHGKSEKCPEAIDFPNKVRSIYYLIGDFYFKQREFTRCIKYFQMDLCINPSRLDAWACLGLSYSAQLETKLNHCERFKSETEFLDKAKYSSICFKKALEISPDPLMLWIEYGTFQYTVHSYCSRILKYESENLSMEKFEFLENQKNVYLDNAENSFEKAIALYEKDDSGEPDERWLQYYILGKIAEKKQKEPTEYLQYYMTASNLLDENEATYPEKINYTNPQHLSVEALELHYRKYASVLKYLELNEGKPIPNALGDFFKKCLESSKYSLKPEPPKPPPADPPVPKTSDSLPPTTTPNSSLGFQEQFLNSLSRLSESNIGLPVDEDVEETAKDEKKQTSVETGSKTVEKMETELETEVVKKETVEKVAAVVSSQEEKKVDECGTVIMISDSEDEGNKNAVKKEQEDQKPQKIEEMKDVQKIFDEMMVQTMKETERQGEVDSDLSGTEKVEEVVLKEENEVKSTKPDGEKDKSEEQIAKAAKPSESETDTDNRRTSVEESNSSSSSSSSSSESSDSESDEDDSSSSSSSSSSEADSEHLSSNEISQLIEKCIAGLEICITRLAQNYKALYRLAHLYFNYKSKKDLTRCKQLLLSEYKCKDGTSISGLFSDRKTNNFFNGIWRIPSTEIDRPGSLCAHMSRCISLLLNVLTTTNDTKTLIDLCLMLRRTPEPDKIYIKDSDRIISSDQALTMCTQCLRSQIKNMSDMTNPQIVKMLQEIFRVYQRLQKHLSSKDAPFANMLIEVYKKFIKEKIPENVNILELATKFCMQHKSIDKPKLPQAVNLTPPLPRGPGIATPPVLPPPSTINASSMPLKRPGSGRPRGRPPLPKIPGQVRQPRASKPSASSGMAKSYAWQKSLFDQSYAYEYLKHYQDELIKQYSQNMNLNQLTQLSQMLSQGQIHNPATATAITNQFLSQTGLLNTSNVMKHMNTSGNNMTQASATQLLESLKQLSPNLKKKLGVDQVLSTLTGLPSSTAANRPSITTPSMTSSSVTTSTKMIPSTSLKQVSASSSTAGSSMSYKGATTSTKPASIEGGGSKNLMKDRPSLSITPVVSNIPHPVTTSPSFIKPTIAPSGGKTLQEKLAEKKKEQQNKQLKNTFQHENQQSEALKRSLNLPNIPSSLTLSKSILPTSTAPSTSILPVPRTSVEVPQSLPSLLKNSTATAKYPLEIGPVPTSKSLTSLTNKSQEVLPTPMMLPKSLSLPTPKFPADSGISISQVIVNKPKKIEEKPTKRLSPIEVSPVRSSTAKTVEQKIKKKHRAIQFEKVNPISPDKYRKSSETDKPSTSLTIKNIQMEISKNKIDLNQNVSLHRVITFPAKKSAPSSDDGDDGPDVICID